MEKGKILIAGQGHLSFQVFRKLKEKGYEPVQVVLHKPEMLHQEVEDQSQYEKYQASFTEAGIEKAQTVFLIDDEDQYNIQFFLIAASLNPSARLIVSLFNDTLAPHLRAGHKNLEVYNPAAIAASLFANASLKKQSKKIKILPTSVPLSKDVSDQSLQHALFLISTVFVGVFVVAVEVFHATLGLSWINAVYFTATVITTTGFGDISLLSAGAPAKLFGVALMFVGVSFISIAFSLIVEWLLVRRAELVLGRKQYTLQGHIILCGLGRLGYQVALDLLKRGNKVLVIESEPDNRFIDLVRGSGGEVFVADARLTRNLRRANIEHAKSLISLVQNDLRNLEIGLVAKSLNPSLQLVLRIFDKDIALQMQKSLHIPTALSASFIASEYLLKKL